ncbi:D-ribose pyranase [Bacillus sp. 1P10SD]|uniref:D-ribose pyranase n=1 Tax=Bacillus sp. 1P10SD TaxID=3132265 RepID=UPI0039A6E1F5
MKKYGILNHPLSELIAATGHADIITVSDAGLPLDPSLPRIDLCLTKGMIPMKDMLIAINDELEIEGIILAEEIKEKSPDQLAFYEELFKEIPFYFIPHIEFKQKTSSSRGIVRTGEAVSYSSVILIAGVTY